MRDAVARFLTMQREGVSSTMRTRGLCVQGAHLRYADTRLDSTLGIAGRKDEAKQHIVYRRPYRDLREELGGDQ